MKKIVFLLCFMGFFANANEKQKIIDCNIIFEQRKGEILKEIEKIDEQQQALQALQSATQSILDQKETDLKKREENLKKAQEGIALQEENIQKLIKKNEKILKEIREVGKGKVSTTYASMKDSKSAAILEALPNPQAAEILFTLDTKIVSKIMAKMSPQKAAELTQMLVKGPPFEEKLEEKELTQSP